MRDTDGYAPQWPFASPTSPGTTEPITSAYYKDGKVVGWVQDDNGNFEHIPQIKFAEGRDRANLRFADVNGDGKADMIWINKINGNSHVS